VPAIFNYDQYVTLKESTTSNAGLGAFTNKNRMFGDTCATFRGEIVRFNNELPFNAYHFQINDKYSIDGSKIPNFDNPSLIKNSKAQFINCGIEEEKVNCKLVPQYPDGDTNRQPYPYLLAVCCIDVIPKGAELFVWYGPEYWMTPENWPLLSQQNRDHLRSNFKNEWKIKSLQYTMTK
jgi:hypothetical protein